MNLAIDYIEENLAGELELSQIAKVACCSNHHFQRMFITMTDISLSEYIRRRRMTLAAIDLKRDGSKIVDVAMKYGYTSPTAFNRAFQSIHGVAPSLIKQDGVTVKNYSPIRFKMSITGTEELNYKIEKKEAFRVVGISSSLVEDSEINWEIIPQAWEIAEKNGTLSKLASLMDDKVDGLLGVGTGSDSLEAWGQYYVAASSNEAIDGKLEEYLVPSLTWAVFYGVGRCWEDIGDLFGRGIMEWLPPSGYEYDVGPDITVLTVDDSGRETFEIWIPIKKV
jgi:AraC family transcriptional regulator